MAGYFHDNRIVHTGFSHICVKSVSEVMKDKTAFYKSAVFDAGFFAGGRQALDTNKNRPIAAQII